MCSYEISRVRPKRKTDYHTPAETSSEIVGSRRENILNVLFIQPFGDQTKIPIR